MRHTVDQINEILHILQLLHPGALRRVKAAAERELVRQSEQMY